MKLPLGQLSYKFIYTGLWKSQIFILTNLYKKIKGIVESTFSPRIKLTSQKIWKRNVAFKNNFHFLFQGLKDWNEGQEGDAGWDAEEEDVSNILREHRKMRKYNLSQ